MARCGNSSNPMPLPAGTSVLAFGNSLTYGTGALPQESYPSRLASRSRWHIHNAGIPGDTAQCARLRIGATLEESRPALALIEIGGNDFLLQRPEIAIKEDIRAMIRAVRQTSAVPILIAVPQFARYATSGQLQEAAMYAELAAEEDVGLATGLFHAILSDERLKTDLIHPNGAGYQKLAENMASALIRAGWLAPN